MAVKAGGSWLKHLGTTWRSVVSVVLTYVIVVVLFFYEEHWLQTMTRWASDVNDWLAHVFGVFSPRGEALFTLTISDLTMMVTLMILFVRVVVMSVVLWLMGKLVNAIWPKRA